MNKGFTLIELIIVICIFLLLGTIFWPIGASFYQQELLSKAEQQVIWILKQARANAINQKNNSAFGVHLSAGEAVIFQGDDFSSRAIIEDVNYSLPKVVAINGLNEIIFAPNTGMVSPAGSIILSSAQSNKEIIINELGVIDY
ncbi:MAG: prepilin-type N-terminal cleavage/methylation domain-containing protein [Candidatus Parcubacteria bacterium]|nr:prepilin-type N-terminal cleavage/methylation domain-containing protein [Candidatus Parcubacteria bacterium]